MVIGILVLKIDDLKAVKDIINIGKKLELLEK